MAYLTKPQAAEMLQISVRTLEGLIKRGQLPAYKIGPQLVRLSADGKISQDETIAFGEALAELGELITAAYELQYAKGAE